MKSARNWGRLGMKFNRYTLSDLATIKYGKNQKKVLSDGGTVPIFGTGGLMGFATTSLYDKPSVLIGRKGTIGKVKYVEQPFWTVDTLFYTIINTDLVIPKYLFYVMSLIDLNNYNEGTTIPSLRTETLNRLEFDIPDLEEQRKILSCLNPIDEKIELNNAINNNLFEQAQALYKDRFIDLTPFDGSMPSDWHLGTVSEIIELHDSKRIPLSSRERAELDKIYPYYGATSVMDYVDRYLFDGIYLLLGEDGTVVDGQGFPILQYVEGKFWVNNHAHIITGKNGFTVELLYLLFSLTNVQSIVTGAVQPKISQANLNKVPVVIPSKTELTAFDESIQPFFAEIRNLRSENDRLASVRDNLLPRLMGGELDVSDIAL